MEVLIDGPILTHYADCKLSWNARAGGTGDEWEFICVQANSTLLTLADNSTVMPYSFNLDFMQAETAERRCHEHVYLQCVEIVRGVGSRAADKAPKLGTLVSMSQSVELW